jgi:hypothetical protein
MLEFNSVGYAGLTAKSALVQTNDPAHAREVISLSAEIVPVFSLNSNMSLILKTSVGQPVSAEAVLSSNASGPVRIKGMGHTFGDKATVKLETIEPGKKYKVILTANADKPAQESGRVFLDIEGAPAPKFSLGAYLEVKK